MTSRGLASPLFNVKQYSALKQSFELLTLGMFHGTIGSRRVC